MEIDSQEDIDVTTMDIPVAYLDMYTDKEVVMMLKGVLVDMVVNIYPQIYHECTTKYERGKPIHYMILKKSL